MSEKPFIRVRVKATGHQIDIHRSHFDPDEHVPVKRVPDTWAPRRPKYRVHYKTSAPKAVEGQALPSSAGTEKEGGEP